MKKNIAIIMGGYSSEYAISIKSGSVVAKHLRPERFNTYAIIIAKESWFYKDQTGIEHEIDKNDFIIDTTEMYNNIKYIKIRIPKHIEYN